MFDIQGSKIVFKTDELAIPPFRDYYNSSKDKAKALKDIEYVVWLYKWDSPYLAYPTNDRPRMVSIDVFKIDNYQPTDAVKQLIKRYNEFQLTPLIRLYQASEDALEWLTLTLHTIREDVEDADLGLEDKMKIATSISRLVKDVEANAKSVDSAKKRAMADQIESGKIRGGGKLGMYEIPR